MFTPIQAIKSLRLHGMTQTDIARAVGTTQATISRIESGRSNGPSFSIAQSLDRVAQRASKLYSKA